MFSLNRRFWKTDAKSEQKGSNCRRGAQTAAPLRRAAKPGWWGGFLEAAGTANQENMLKMDVKFEA